MIAQMIRTNTIADDLANVDTTGFKKQVSVFRSSKLTPIYRVTGESGPFIGSMASGTRFVQNETNFSQGSLQETNNPLDLAIEGPDFFSVKTPGGDFYTRNGAFFLNSKGELVTQNGYPVLDIHKHNIVLGPGTVQIDQNGTIAVNGTPVSQIQLVTLPQTQQIYKMSDNLYRYTGTTGKQQGTVRQGFLESSNVNAIKELVKLIQAERTYDASSKALTEEDNALKLAVTNVGTGQ